MSKKLVDIILKYYNFIKSLETLNENFPENLIKKPPLKIVMAYPDYYENGLPNLGTQTLIGTLKKRKDIIVDRVYLPTKKYQKIFENNNIELFSLERNIPLSSFDVIAFTISFEELYVNILKILELSKIPFFRKDRKKKYPIIIGGGPCVSYNPEPLADFFDAFGIGEGEVMINEIIDKIIECKILGKSKKQILTEISRIEGVYIPSFYRIKYDNEGNIKKIEKKKGSPLPIKRRSIKELNNYPAYSLFFSPKTIYEQTMLSIEVSRGCNMNCRFCFMGNYLRKLRYLKIEEIEKIIKSNIGITKNVKLFYEGIPQKYWGDLFKKLEEMIDKYGIKLYLGSMRAELLTEEMIKVVAKSGQKMIILAPEVSEGYLRNMINKSRITDNVLFKVIDLSCKHGIENFGLYLMIGLPKESEDDIKKLAKLIINVRQRMDKNGCEGFLEVHINPLFPKPFTPFQYAPMESIKSCNKKIKLLEKTVEKNYRIYNKKINKTIIGAGGPDNKNNQSKIVFKTIVGTRTVFSQPILSRGDRRIGKVIFYAYKYGNTISAWKKAIKKTGIDHKIYFKKRDVNSIFPWSFIDIGVKSEYFKKEWERGLRGQYTPPCREDDYCRMCGFCGRN